MVRSLYSGITGLRNHQIALDVTGNNIANVNTTGFKAGRVTFEESMAQLLKGSSRPPGNSGGTNPIQVGLGMSIGSIDTILTQGNLQATGQITDLAIEGRGYFAYSSGAGIFYGRNGALQMDSTGKLVSPTNGYVLQGKMAAPDGSYPVGTSIGDLRIPFGEKAPAQATSEVKFGSNLDSDGEGLGTITHSSRFLTAVNDTINGLDPGRYTLTSLFDENGNDLGIRVDDVITISVADPADPTTPFTAQYRVVAGTPGVGEIATLEDLRVALDAVLENVRQVDTFITATGQLQIDTILGGGSGNLNNVQITSNRPGSNSFVANTFSFPPTIEDFSTSESGTVLVPVVATDTLESALDASGQALGLEDGDPIRINGAVGGRAIQTDTLTYTSATTMQDLLDSIQDAFNLPQHDATPYRNMSVSINPADTDDDRLPDGSIVVRGQPETTFALTTVSVIATNEDYDPIAPTRFNANMGMTEVQRARDTTVHSTSIVVYDESGDAHTLTTTFTHSGIPNEWLWEITMEGGEAIISGNAGRLTFGQDGSPSAFTYNDNSTGFRFDPMNGSNIVEMALDVGRPGSFDGITQFRADNTTAAREQDGYPMGKLEEISIDEYGEITGIYTNGVNKSIAKIYLAEFNNPAGLFKRGDSMYAVSNNSGEAVMQQPGVGTASKLKPGALEMSNVELATEFTTLITTQRGYQANARVITTSDAMLQELVQLVR